ncbi:MAG: sugar ABC transporter permease [Candidatus Limivivens sp.]|nr:sugar ABC transporter permease [Candidatus Limivivens sp.]
MNKKKKIRAYRKRDYQAFIYLAPWLVGLCVLQLYPFLSSFYYSFTDYQITSKPVWNGIQNYITLFTADSEFITALWVTIKFALLTVPGKLILALAVAVFLNRNLKGINLIRTLYYVPSLFGGSIAIAMLWKVMFMDNGVINSMLAAIGITGISWLGDPKVALVTICMLEIWQFGSSMVMFLAALKQVPSSLYEAASIDGAGKVKKFIYITLPQITPIIFFNMIMQTINALQTYTSSAVITNGGPLKATYVMGLKLYKEGFSYFKMGYASAISWVMFALILVVTLLLFRSSSSWVFYEDEGEF